MIFHRRFWLTFIAILLVVSTTVRAQETETPEPSPTAIPTEIPTLTPLPTATDVPTAIPTETFTPEPSFTVLPPPTATDMPSLTPSLTETATDATATLTASPLATETGTASQTLTATATSSLTASATQAQVSATSQAVQASSITCDPSDPIQIGSVSSSGDLGNNDSGYYGLSISDTGSSVVFSSSASNLVANDTNGKDDIFVFDRNTCQTTRISTSLNGNQANNASSAFSISTDGKIIAFASLATNLIPGDTNSGIFIRNFTNNTLIRISNSGSSSNSPSISGDGRYVTYFNSVNANARDIFLYDVQSNISTLIEAVANGFTFSKISRNGNVVVYGNGNSSLSIYSLATQQISAKTFSINAAGLFDVSANGGKIVFASDSTTLVANDTNNKTDIFVLDNAANQIIRASVNTGGIEANNSTAFTAISPDGRYVSFISNASNLVSGDTNNTSDVFLRDLMGQITFWVASGPNGEPTNNGAAGVWAPISGDDRFIGFSSNASNLVTGDSNSKADVFIAQLASFLPAPTPTPSRTPLPTLTYGAPVSIFPCNPSAPMIDASVDSNGAQAMGPQFMGSSREPSISPDGRYIVYSAYADNLVSGDTNGKIDVFMYDRISCQTVRASVAADGTQGNNDSRMPSVSPNGRYVAFTSTATNLTSGDSDTSWDVYIKDLQTGAVTRIPAGYPASGGIWSAYFGDDSNLIFTTPTSLSLYNLQIQQVSVLAAASYPDISRRPISADLRYVIFGSDASNLVAGDTNNARDIFLLDRQIPLITRLSVSSASVQANNESYQPYISANGRYVEFVSGANNLVGGDNNNYHDIFVRDLQTGTTSRVSLSNTGTEGNGHSDNGSMSDDGRYVAFESLATNLDGSNTNGLNAFVRDLVTNQTYLISRNPDGTPANQLVESPKISGNGDFIVFTSLASTLIAGDTNYAIDAFVAQRAAFAPTVTPTATPNANQLTLTAFNGTAYAAMTATRQAEYITATAGAVATNSAAQTATAAALDPNNLIVNTTNIPLNPYANDQLCDANGCTLQEAVQASNTMDGVQTIRFYIAGNGVQTITLSSPLTITSSVIIDGTTQPGYIGQPIIELVPASTSTSSAIVISSTDPRFYDPNISVTIRGLIINSFAGTGIVVGNGQQHLIEQNYIGTDASGTLAKGNDTGIIFFAPNSIIRDNLISGNDNDGLYLFSNGGRNSTSNVITGNLIGTDISGTLELPNHRGIRLTEGASNNMIGGTLEGNANVISGNTAEGIMVDGSTSSGNIISGNLIGLDANSDYLLGNGGTGITINGAPNTTIGGATSAEGNDIWGNLSTGIYISNFASNTIIQNNNVAQNGIQGIGLTTSSTHTTVQENTIASNSFKGIEISSSTGNRLTNNRIYGNGNLGIDLNGDGITLNDVGDADSGANNLQNFPVITSAVNSAVSATIIGTLNSQPNQTYHLEFFANVTCSKSGYGEGQDYIGSTDVLTDASGNTSFSAPVSSISATTGFVSATATDLNGNTSEFSGCRLVQNVLGIGSYQENNINLTYSGKWINFSGTGPKAGAFKYTNDASGKMSFWIDSSVGRISLYRTTYSNYGSTQIYLDDGVLPIATINNTTSTLIYGQAYTLSIAPGNHHVELRNVGTKYSSIDQIDLLAAAVPLIVSAEGYAETDANLSYSGVWMSNTNAAALGGTRRYTNTINSSVSFNINSSVGRVTIYRTTGPIASYGSMQVLVDGNSTPLATMDNTNPTLLYRQPFTFVVTPGDHLITLKNIVAKSSDIDHIMLLPPSVAMMAAINPYQETDTNLTFLGNWRTVNNASALGGSRITTTDPNSSMNFNIDGSVGQVTIYRTTGTAAAGYGSMRVYLDGSATAMATISNVSATLLYGQPFTFAVIPGSHLVTIKNVGIASSDIDQISLQPATAALTTGDYAETEPRLIYNGKWTASSYFALGSSATRNVTKDANGSVIFTIDNSVGRITLYRTVGTAAAGYGSMQVLLDNSGTPLATISNINPTLVYMQPFTFVVTPGTHIITLKNVGVTSSDVDQITLLPPADSFSAQPTPYAITDNRLTFLGNWRSVIVNNATRLYTNDPTASMSFSINNTVGVVVIYRSTGTVGYGSMQIFLDGITTPMATVSNIASPAVTGLPFAFPVIPGNHLITIKNVGTTTTSLEQKIELLPARTVLSTSQQDYQEYDPPFIYNGKWVSVGDSTGLPHPSVYMTRDPNANMSFVIDSTVARITVYRTMGMAAAGYGSMQVFMDGGAAPLATISEISPTTLYHQPFTFAVTPGNHIITLRNVGTTYSDTEQISVRGAPAVMVQGVYQESDTNLNFSGNWRTVTAVGTLMDEHMITNDPNGSVSFSINNSVGRVTLYRTTGTAAAGYGSMRVYLDGSTTPLATISNVNTTLLYGQPFTFAVIPGSHLITIKNVGTTSSDIDQISLLSATTALSSTQSIYQETEPAIIYNGKWVSNVNALALGGTRLYTKDAYGSASFVIDSSVGRVTLYRTTGTAAAGYGSMQVFLDGSPTPLATISNVSTTLLYGQPFTFAVLPGDHIITLRNVGITSSDIDQITVLPPTTPFTAGLLYQESEPTLIYNGQWTNNIQPAALGGARIITKDPNGRVSFVIDSSVGRVTLYRTTGTAAAGYGSMQVFLDNSSTALTSISNVNPTLLYQQPFTFVVTPGSHIITLKNVGSTSSDLDQITLLPPAAPLVTSVNPYQETNTDLTFTGNWRSVSSPLALGGARIYTNDPNGSMSFSVDSSVVRVTLYRTTGTAAAGFGSMRVYLDGSAIPLMTISNVSATLHYGQPFSFTITAGSHIIVIKNVGSTYSDIDQIVLAAS